LAKKESIMIYLVTGATGNVGGRVVARLIARGQRPRVLVRDAGKARARFGEHVDVCTGDLGDAAALAAAFAGVDACLTINSGAEIAARDQAAARAAAAAGVQHLVKLSSLDARRAGGSAVGAGHAAGEAAIRDSGVPFTFVQPAGFMSNALGWAASLKAEGVVRAATGEGRVAMIHPDDIADVATALLLTRRHVGEALPITGPTALSYAEMTALLSVTVGKPFTFRAVSDAEMRERLLVGGAAPALADALVALWRAVREGHSATVTENVARVLGRAPLTFARWAEENAAAFR
jgi:uncharacterized protein YbjT (DUF2867 family)